MSRAISLFGSLPKLSALLRDVRATAIFDQFLKHHRTGEGIAEAVQYRRALTLDDMREAVINLLGHRSRKKKEESFEFIDQLLKELIRLGAMHSGYVLDCSHCNLEEWYPIDEVAETFRCRRCLAVEVRPPSPPIFFRLNEALYQAYANNFSVPTLVLDILHKFSNASFIYSPQIKLDSSDVHSPELDVVAICDGQLVMGEAKATDKIRKKQLDVLESAAIRVKAQRIVLGTTSRDSCRGIDCEGCSQNTNYADNAFSHGSTRDPHFWGTRERTMDLRQRRAKQGVQLISICTQDILSGAMLKDRSRRFYVPTA